MKRTKISSPLVSVIVPTYNVESYLVKCLESINEQTYQNFECIIIVDGATDSSLEIAKQYCKTHSKFKVYYQDNAGSGPARNHGIKKSSGEFLCFIDPDDWVEPNYISTLIAEQQIGNYDLVISQSVDYRINKNDEVVGKTEHNKPLVSYNTQHDCRLNFPYVMFDLHYLDGPINKLYRREIIIANNVMFPDYRRSQDMVFNFRYYSHIQSISTIPDHTYCIRVEFPLREGRGRVFKDYNDIVKKIYIEIKEQLIEWGLDEFEKHLSTWSFWYIYACIKRKIITNERYGFVNDEPYRTIIKNASPKLFTQKLVRLFLLSKFYLGLNMFVKLIEKSKQQSMYV